MKKLLIPTTIAALLLGSVALVELVEYRKVQTPRVGDVYGAVNPQFEHIPAFAVLYTIDELPLTSSDYVRVNVAFLETSGDIEAFVTYRKLSDITRYPRLARNAVSPTVTPRLEKLLGLLADTEARLAEAKLCSPQ